MAEVVITKDNFEQEVAKASLPVLVDFWATWCGPCRMLAPVIEEIAEQYDGKLIVGKVDVDEEADLAMQFQVSSIPMVALFKDGQLVQTAVGYRPKSFYEDMIQDYI